MFIKLFSCRIGKSLLGIATFSLVISLCPLNATSPNNMMADYSRSLEFPVYPMMTPNITSLPSELILSTFSFLETPTLVRGASEVCKEWRDLARDRTIWRDREAILNPMKCLDSNVWPLRSAHLIIPDSKKWGKTSRSGLRIFEVEVPVGHVMMIMRNYPDLLKIRVYCDSRNFLQILEAVSESSIERVILCANSPAAFKDKTRARKVGRSLKLKELTVYNFSELMGEIIQESQIEEYNMVYTTTNKELSHNNFCPVSLPQLRAATFYNPLPTSIIDFSQLGNLTVLNFESTSNFATKNYKSVIFSNLRLLAKLEKLSVPEVCSKATDSLEWVKTLPTSLTDLDFSWNKLNNKNKGVAIFAHLVNLKKLNLSFNQMASMKGIESLTLKVLQVNNNNLKAIKDISRCHTLEELDISGNPVTDFNGIENLPFLTKLVAISLAKQATFDRTKLLPSKYLCSQLPDVAKDLRFLAKGQLLSLASITGGHRLRLRELNVKDNQMSFLQNSKSAMN